MSKIKAYKIIKDFPFRQLLKVNPAIGLSGCLKVGAEYSLEELKQATGLPCPEAEFKYVPGFFEPVMEPEKPKMLFRSDRSLITAPNPDTKVRYIDEYFRLRYSIYSELNNSEILLKLGYVFLNEDFDFIVRKIRMLEKQLEIQNEIDRLNAEEGNTTSKIFLIALYPETEVNADCISFVALDKFGLANTPENKKISDSTAKAILAKYSQDELKQFLEIII